jgi:hypothetical protein
MKKTPAEAGARLRDGTYFETARLAFTKPRP